MKAPNSEHSPTSVGKRIGAVVVDQLLLVVVAIILGVVFFSNYGTTLDRVMTEFGQIIATATPEEVETELNTYTASEQFMRDIETLQTPYAWWLATSVIISALYYITLTAQNGQTIGKRLFKIKVVEKLHDIPSLLTATERYFLLAGLSSISSALIVVELIVYGTFTDLPNPLVQTLHSLLDLFIMLAIIIGGIMIIARNDRRGYHDLACDTRVIDAQ